VRVRTPDVLRSLPVEIERQPFADIAMRVAPGGSTLFLLQNPQWLGGRARGSQTSVIKSPPLPS
jgi:hypothetical protein